MMDRKGQLFPQTGGNDFLSKIEDWVTNNPILFIIIVAAVIIAVLWSIQYISCNMGFGVCLKVACFGKFGIGCG